MKLCQKVTFSPLFHYLIHYWQIQPLIVWHQSRFLLTFLLLPSFIDILTARTISLQLDIDFLLFWYCCLHQKTQQELALATRDLKWLVYIVSAIISKFFKLDLQCRSGKKISKNQCKLSLKRIQGAAFLNMSLHLFWGAIFAAEVTHFCLRDQQGSSYHLTYLFGYSKTDSSVIISSHQRENSRVLTKWCDSDDKGASKMVIPEK